jgi:hypothetical protein
MGQCKYCGKKGFFVSIDKDGLCRNCAPILLMQVQQSIRVIKESEDIINRSKNVDIRISRCDTILIHLKRLIELEQKGISTINISPSKLFQQVTNERDKILSEATRGKPIKDENNQIKVKNEHEIDYDNYDEIIDGYEFIATLSPTTPLKALNHHREKIKRTTETELPNYGDSRYGIWLPFFNDDRYFKSPSRRDIREVKFLKKFRETYESELSHDQKHEIISALLEEYDDMSEQVSRAADWYLWELMEIAGISASIAKVMYFEGIKSKKSVEMGSDTELLKIPGIGPGRLKQIRAYFSNPTGN